MLCNFFEKIQKGFFGHENIKKTDLKSGILLAVWIFFLSEALTTQNSPVL